jgi:hypothetical protein
MSKHEPSKHAAYHDLLDACRHEEKGCPICRLTLAGVAKSLDTMIYEFVNDPPTREALVAAGGFCNGHAWQLGEMPAALGVAIMLRDVLQAARQTLGAPANPDGYRFFGGRRGVGSVRDRLAAMMGPERQKTDIADPHLACPACRTRASIERRFVGVLLDHLQDEEFVAALTLAGGLCLIHMDQAARIARGPAALDRLAAVQSQCLQGLEDELVEFARKHDYRFRHESYGAEKDSWLRAIAMVTGMRGIR